MIPSRLLSVLFSALGLASLQAQNNPTQVPLLDPAEELASFKVADGMEVNLFASEPMVAKPIQMAWDAMGRLWVASSAIYPHIKPGQQQSDKILILEDTDRDGKADKSTVFYEGLLIPTGIWPQDGGAYVANSTELLFMKDSDGDGKADTREVLLSGFGTEDTHHILHSIKGGPDGNLYMNQSVYIHSHIETPFGVRRLMGSGIWQYHPVSGRLEVFSMGQINPWGHIFDRWGQSFTTDGAYGEGINYTFPGATFRCLPDQLPRVLKGLNPGQPKQSGLEIISGRHFPDEWQGNMITNDFRGHRVNRFAITEQGSGYASRQMPDLITSSHGSFRPVDVNMGPDGALYLADWFNPIIQHGEVDFRDPRRDQTHGRIWRITAKGREKCPQVNFPKLDENQLFEQLKAPENWVRYWAKQEIKSRRIPDLTKKLASFVEKNGFDPHLSAEAMWTAQTCGLETFASVFSSLLKGEAENKAAEPRMRAAAVRVLRQLVLTKGISSIADSDRNPISPASFDLLCKSLATDAHPRVRLEAVNLLRVVGTPRAVEIATAVLDMPMDANLDFALWRTCYELAPTWLPAFQKGDFVFGNAARTLFALKAANKPDAAALLTSLVLEKKVAGENAVKLIEIIGATGSKAQINLLLGIAKDNGFPADQRKASLEALVTAHQQRQLIPDNPGEALVPILDSAANPALIPALRLAGLWKIENLRPSLEKIASSTDPVASPAAMQSLADLGGASSAFLQQLLSSKQKPEEKSAVLNALIRLDLRAATSKVVEFLVSLKESGPADDSLIHSYLTRTEGPAILAAALTDKSLNPSVAANALQKTSAVGGDTAALMAALTKSGGLKPITALTPDEMKQLIADVAANGNPARGESIYRRSTLQCAVCHAIGPVGGIVGPNLLSVGSSAPMDYIIDSLLEPGKKIKEGYATAMVRMKDGTVHSGFLARRDDREVLLRDAAGEVRSLAAANVANVDTIPVSLMPAGLTSSLRRDEFIDLARFLGELGKDGPYKVQEDGALRQWRNLDSESNGRQVPFVSLTNGTLPLDELFASPTRHQPDLIVESAIDVVRGGPITIALSGGTGIQLEIDGRKMPTGRDRHELPLETGRHSIRLRIDKGTPGPVKVQIVAVAGGGSAKPLFEP
jgi:putative heme-binding domain-containing protein